jgi:hypothetical protein
MIEYLKGKVCKHLNAVTPLYDNTDWKIGDICTKCNRVWIRKNIPNYLERLKYKIKLLKVGKL